MRPGTVGELFTKDGKLIVGTLELVQARCDAELFTVQEDGTVEPNYEGHTEIFYDGMHQARDAQGRLLYLDADGGEHPIDDLVFVPCETEDDLPYASGDEPADVALARGVPARDEVERPRELRPEPYFY